MNKTTQSHLPSSGAVGAIPTTHSTADQEVLVKVEGVSKKFCRSLKKSLWYGLCDIGGELNPFRRQVAEVAGSGLLVAGNGSKPDSSELATSNSPLVTPAAAAARDEDLRDGEFYAVRDVSFELRRGECLGLIGHNGAGKTTLLKMLNGLIKPDAGTITMRGRVGALIALGAGFNPILTGRENIYINGSVLGLSKKEIDEKIDEIIDFAEIGEFIDSPVQNYSSGMSVRLGFAVASSLSPDVLILDEVLAVGDIGFVIKCLNRVRQLTDNAAVIFVSHQMQFVSQFCSRVILMDHGRPVLDVDDVQEAVGQYFSLARSVPRQTGAGSVTLHAVNLRREDAALGSDQPILRQGRGALVDFDFTVEPNTDPAVLHFTFVDASSSEVMTCLINDERGQRAVYHPGRHRITLDVGVIELNSGTYTMTFGAAGLHSRSVLLLSQGLCPFTVTANHNHWAKVVRQLTPKWG